MHITPSTDDSNRFLSAVASALLGLMLAVGSVSAQDIDLPFVSGSTGADGAMNFYNPPPGRYQLDLAYDSVRKVVVMFSGRGAGADTWLYDAEKWIQITPPVSPPQSYGYQMEFDTSRQKTVLFTASGETWEFDGSTWEKITPLVSPPARGFAAMAYNSTTQKMILFGGEGSLNDTWQYDGTNWTLLSPPVSPPGRWSARLAFDSVRNRMVLFGGWTGTYTGDTWEFNGTTWVEISPPTSPSARYGHHMAFDSSRGRIVLFGGHDGAVLNDLWSYNGTDWVQDMPTGNAQPVPTPRHYGSMAYDSDRNRMVLFGGNSINATYEDDTYELSGTTWSYKWNVDDPAIFDMSGRADGIWNFTTITIEPSMTVQVRKNAENTPLTWLATGQVLIDGILDLDGQNASEGPGGNVPGGQARGGPGGFDGGLGGIRFDFSNSYTGQPGGGPGGGDAGAFLGADGVDATHLNTYGNIFLQPLIGGSGGGGAASSDTSDGEKGAGGGGALYLASSRDITLNGTISAIGGGSNDGGAGDGGGGSGGAVRLVADRLTGTGRVYAYGQSGGEHGRIRLEGFQRDLIDNAHSPAPTGSVPVQNIPPVTQPALEVTSVTGIGVPQPPSGSWTNPDVIFSETGPVTIVITGSNIPNGTPISLRVTTSGGLLAPAPVALSGGQATFNLTIPQGLGSIQASAQFNLP